MSRRMKLWAGALAGLRVEADGGVHGLLGGAHEALEREPQWRARLEKVYALRTKDDVLAFVDDKLRDKPPLDLTPLDEPDDGLRLQRIRPADKLKVAPEGLAERLRASALLLREHRATLARAGFTAYEVHHAVVALGFASLASLVSEAEASERLSRASARARRSYGSFAEYGAHVLLGEATLGGEWDVPLARAYRRLVDREGGPWRTFAWEEGHLEAPELVTLEMRVVFQCSECESWATVSRLGGDTLCPSCLHVIHVAEERWQASFGSSVAEVLPWSEGYEGRVTDYESDLRVKTQLTVRWPACACGARFDVGSLREAGTRGGVTCAGCGAVTPARAADDLVRTLVPGARAVLGEREGSRLERRETRELALACDGCGAPVAPKPNERNAGCGYCGHTFRLPEELWARLYEGRADTRMTVIGVREA